MKFIDRSEEWWLPGAKGKRDIGNYCLIGIKFQFWKMRKVLQWVVVMVAKQCECI